MVPPLGKYVPFPVQHVKLTIPALLELILATHAGMTTEEFRKSGNGMD
jgi:hypothetical protein